MTFKFEVLNGVWQEVHAAFGFEGTGDESIAFGEDREARDGFCVLGKDLVVRDPFALF